MAVATHTDCRIYLAQFDVSGDHNEVSMEAPYKELDARVFTNTAGNIVAGLPEPKFQGKGFVTLGAGAIHEVLHSNLAVPEAVVTVCPTTGVVGEPALFMRTLLTKYTLAGKVNEILPFDITGAGQGLPLVAGQVFVAKGDKSASGNSSVLLLGPATRGIYAALHVFSKSGTLPTLDVIVASDALQAFGSPSTVLTFTQATGATSQFVSLASANTDTYYRVSYTIGGSATPTFSFVVVVGIL